MTSERATGERGQAAPPEIVLTPPPRDEERAVAAARRAWRSGRFIDGPLVEEFEQRFAAYCGCAYGVAASSGTAAIHLALLAAGVGPGDEVVTAANTFVATIEPICYCGAVPVFADVDPDTYTLDPGEAAAAMTPRTKAILAVHLHGCPADVDALADAAQARGAALIEDAAQAHGAQYKGRRAGSLGDAAAFSFHPAKNLPAFGSAGLVTTDCAQIADACSALRNHGRRGSDAAEAVGYNYRLDAVQAAALLDGLDELDAQNARRRAHAAIYFERLADLPLHLPRPPAGVEHAFNVFCITTPRRDALRAFLAESGIETAVYYPTPLHRHPAYERLARAAGPLPATEAYCAQALALPVHPLLDDEAIHRVCDAILQFFDTSA